METNERLLDAAYQVFSDVGFRRATTRRIAQAAGVNEATIFRHYPSKEALMLAAMEFQSNRMIALLRQHSLPSEPADMEKDLYPYLQLILTAMIQARQAHRTALGEWGHNRSFDRYLLLTTDYVCEEMCRYFVRAGEKGLLTAAIGPQTAAQSLLGTVFADALIRDIMPDRYPLTPDESARAYLKTFLHGVAGGAGEPSL